MRTPRRVAAAAGTAAVSVALVAAGCVPGGDGGAVADKPAASYPADAVVLRVGYVGGFSFAHELLTRLPLITVYGDGLVITEGPQPSKFPGPVLPSIETRRITPAGIDRLVRHALAAGVGSSTDYGKAEITDNATTRFVVRTDTAVRTTEVYALGETDVYGVSRGQQRARDKLRKLIDALRDLPGTLGADAGGPTQPYRPSAAAGVGRRWVKVGEQEHAERVWLGPGLPGKPFDIAPEISCVLVTGDAVEPVLDAARDAHGATPWRSGGERWSLNVRPLLPDESGCADLGKLANR